MRGVIFAGLGIGAESLCPRENNTGVFCRWKLLTLSHTCVADRAYYSSQLLNAYCTGTRRRCILAKVNTGMCLKMCCIRAPSASDTSFTVDYRHLQGVSSTRRNVCQESIFSPFTAAQDVEEWEKVRLMALIENSKVFHFKTVGRKQTKLWRYFRHD